MSRTRQEAIRCSRCNAQQPFTVWESINVTVEPKLKKSLLDGGLTTFRCKRCGNEAHVAYDCLYHDMDRSLAIWLKEADNDEGEVAKQIFLTATQIKTTRTVRTIHELYDKIRIFDDGPDDFEIELFKFFTCIRQQIDLSLPFHYAETQTSFFGRKSLVFAVARRGEFETISCSLRDYEAAVDPVAKKVRPLVPDSAFEWAYLNRSFILQVLEDAGLMQALTPKVDRWFGKDEFYEERAQNLVKTASVFATTSIQTVMESVPLIDTYFNTRVLSTDSWDFYMTIACVGTAFITIADYVPKGQGENACMKIAEELVKFHPKAYLALENFNGLLHNSCDAGIPFHNAVGNWLAINLLGKDQPDKEDIEAFAIVGALIQQTFGG